MTENISDIRKGLTYDEYKTEFLKTNEVKNKPSLMNDFNNYWTTYNSKEPPKTGEKGLIGRAVAPQQFTVGYGMISSEAKAELIGADTIADAAVTIGKALFGSQSLKDGLKSLFSTGMDTLFKGMMDIVGKEVELRNKLNSQIGIGKELSKGYRDNILDAYGGVQGMGYSFDELADTAISATKETGRFFTMNETVMEDMAVTSRAFIGDMRDMGRIFSDFEKVGLGAEKTLENINAGGKSSLVLGLNIRKTTEEFQKNIGKINQYGFENGTQGLNRMVQKSVEFRMNMQNVFDIAEKVMSPEKAIDLAANLQVLGGAIGSLGDPFQMMYMATNNVEGLQDALIGAAESLATYNSEQGKFEISGVNLRRARAMAEELGMSYQDLSNMAIAAAERTSAAADLMTAGVAVDDEQKEFITNLARMGKDGKMVIEVPPSIAKELGIQRTQALEDLDQRTADAILKNQEAFKQMDPKDIALEQFTATQQLALTVSEIAAMLKVEFAKTYRDVGGELDKYVKQADDMLKNYIKGDRSNADVNAEIESRRSQLQKEYEKETKTKTSAQPLTPTNVNNNQQTNQNNTNTDPNNKPLTAAEMERIMRDARTQTKYDDKGKIVISNSIDSTNPNGYLYVDL